MPTHHRRAFRHAVTLPCQIVRERDFRLVADVALDVSTAGMRVPTALRVLTGEPLIVSFRPPLSTRWLDAQAVVARVVHGRREGERGRQLGIAFQGLDGETQRLLFEQLRHQPPATHGSARGRHPRRTDAG